MRRKVKTRRHLEVLLVPLVVTICVAMRNVDAQVAARPAIRQLDHVMILTPHHDRLVALFADTLRLPVVWPAPGTPFDFSTGIALGDVNLEFVPPRGAGETRFSNLAFQPNDLATAPAQLRQLGLDPFEPSVETTDAGAKRWTTIGFRQAFRGPGFFLIQYHAFDMDERRSRFDQILRSRNGGPLGLRRVREIQLLYPSSELPAARRAWAQLLGLASAPADDEFQPPSGPRVRLLEGLGSSSSLLVEVASLAVAEVAARSLGLLSSASPDSLVLNPARLGGLRLTLVER